MHRTVTEVNDYLKDIKRYVSDQSTRRMLAKMVKEGLLVEIGRGEKNAIIYTKAVFNPHRYFSTLDSKVVQLTEFMHHVMTLDSKLLAPNALVQIKRLLLDNLASTYPEPYENKNLPPVAKEDVRAALTNLMENLATWHSFIKNYLDAKIWEDFQRDSLAKEFKETYPKAHALIVDRAWEHNNVKAQGSQD